MSQKINIKISNKTYNDNDSEPPELLRDEKEDLKGQIVIKKSLLCKGLCQPHK